MIRVSARLLNATLWEFRAPPLRRLTPQHLEPASTSLPSLLKQLAFHLRKELTYLRGQMRRS